MLAGRRSGQAGYILFGICIAVVLLGIAMTMAVPVWKTVVQREKEEELIWRANQYLQAIDRYQRKYPGAFPTSFAQLRDQKFIRKLYKDPMTPDGEWLIRRQLSPNDPNALPGANLGQGGQGGQRGPSGPSGQGGSSGQGGRGAPQRGRSPNPNDPSEGNASANSGQGGGLSGGGSRFSTGSRSGFGSGGIGNDQGIGGIIGVASKSKEKSIRILNGKDRYNEWIFVYAPQNQGLPGQTPPGVAPGTAPGTRPGPPRGNQNPSPFGSSPGAPTNPPRRR